MIARPSPGAIRPGPQQMYRVVNPSQVPVHIMYIIQYCTMYIVHQIQVFVKAEILRIFARKIIIIEKQKCSNKLFL